MMFDLQQCGIVRTAARVACCLLVLLAPSVAVGQRLKVRTEQAPFFVGEAIAIEVDAEGFENEPKIEIAQSDQKSVNLAFRNTGRSESTRIFQSGGKLIRNRVVKTTFFYQVSFDSPGEYTIGPFSADFKGKKITHPAITYEVKDIEVTKDMRVEIDFPQKNLYPGQKVPIELRWLYSGDPRLVRGLTIRSKLFDQFRFVDEVAKQGSSTLPITTAKGIQALPADFERKLVDGQQYLVGTVRRILIPDRPGKIEYPETFVSFQKVVGTRRSTDAFDSFFDVQPETVPFRGVGYPVKFEVKSFPEENRPVGFRGAVGEEFRISTSINRTELRTGDPLTLQINILGDGNLETIGIPDLASHFSQEDFEWPDGEVPGALNQGQKQFRVTIRIKNESVKTIPAIEFSWFDPKREEYVTTRSESISVDVKKGVLVTSDDVINNNRVADVPENTPDAETALKLDLSIETNVDRLLNDNQQTHPMTWILYVLGLVAIGSTLVINLARRKPDEAKVFKKQIQHQCQELLLLRVNNCTIEDLVGKLRELQQALGREDRPKEVKESHYDALDLLISRCDAVSFRPGDSTPDERKQLIDEAQKLVNGLKNQ